MYEYPKENAALSPTMPDRQGWATYLANSSPFSSTMTDTLDHSDVVVESPAVDFNALDGFNVSSSSRPFVLTKFSTERHTWPTDSDFSWSQTQVGLSVVFHLNPANFELFPFSNEQSDKELANSNINCTSETMSSSSSSANDETREPSSSNSIDRPTSSSAELVGLTLNIFEMLAFIFDHDPI